MQTQICSGCSGYTISIFSDHLSIIPKIKFRYLIAADIGYTIKGIRHLSVIVQLIQTHVHLIRGWIVMNVCIINFISISVNHLILLTGRYCDGKSALLVRNRRQITVRFRALSFNDGIAYHIVFMLQTNTEKISAAFQSVFFRNL